MPKPDPQHLHTLRLTFPRKDKQRVYLDIVRDKHERATNELTLERAFRFNVIQHEFSEYERTIPETAGPSCGASSILYILDWCSVRTDEGKAGNATHLEDGTGNSSAVTLRFEWRIAGSVSAICRVRR